MINLVGRNDSDIWCASELAAAGIDIDAQGRRYGETRTRVAGRIGEFIFTRAWRYWMVRGRVPLDVAQRLYADPIGRTDVRAAGHCACPPPDEWVEWFDGDEKVWIDPDGSQEREWRAFDAKGIFNSTAMPRFAATTDGLQAYVTTYHIDSAEGLRLFADAVRAIGANHETENETAHTPEQMAPLS